MTAVKTINTSQSTISAVTRKWHLIVIGVVVATLILRKAFSTPEEPQVDTHREWSVLSESSRTGKSDRICVGRWSQLAYIDCHPDPEPSPLACWERGCCWIPDRQMAAPQCVLPFGTNRYVLTSTAKTMDAWTANLTLLKNAPAPLPMSESTTVAVTFIAFAYEFARLRPYGHDADLQTYAIKDIAKRYEETHAMIHGAREKEFETPVPPVPQGDGVPIVSYDSTAHSNVVSVSPNRFPAYQLRFLVDEMFHASDLKQLPVKLPSEIVYGLRGAHGVPFANASQWSKHKFFRSHPQQRTSAVYESVHPFFVVASKNTSVGLFLRTSNDVGALQHPLDVVSKRRGEVAESFLDSCRLPTRRTRGSREEYEKSWEEIM